MRDKKIRIGEKWKTNEGYEVEIIEYFTNKNCSIMFEDGGILHNISYDRIVKGKVKNPNHKSVYETGYTGYGEYSHSKDSVASVKWRSMMERCYYLKYHKRDSTYKDCTVHSDWHNFQNFCKWFYENYIEKFDLDKDILFKDNKLYSSKTCCFVPKEINTLLTNSGYTRGKYPIGVCYHKQSGKFASKCNIGNGKQESLGLYNTPEEAFKAYKDFKESRIKFIAKRYKDEITTETYEALINYIVEITD